MHYLNIDAIRSSLLDIQHHFSDINSQLSVKRSPPSDEAIENLLAGYAKIDAYLAEDFNLFAMGNSHALLELDYIVLFHSADIEENEQNTQFQATKQHFYEAEDGGIGGLMEWLELNDNTNVWKQVAGVFCYMVAQPQLFLEGNHRVATLVASYLLMKEGHAPLVVTVENARLFFEISEQMKEKHKNSLIHEFFSLPRLTNSFAQLLEESQSDAYLLKPATV
ncbi:hypothetical protein [Thiomicrorhabdus sp.]|uniref:hypothetical protein n=1 Tax=Thiomicrorhabdus sp. TaxID=2039724 RepID=UPI0029C762E5|nr:hypothetical protein [Thiomicrorhabdus sp.]